MEKKQVSRALRTWICDVQLQDAIRKSSSYVKLYWLKIVLFIDDKLYVQMDGQTFINQLIVIIYR